MFNSVISLSLIAVMLICQLVVVVLSAIAVVIFSILGWIKNNLILISTTVIAVALLASQ